jgi:hypothetical protein
MADEVVPTRKEQTIFPAPCEYPESRGGSWKGRIHVEIFGFLELLKENLRKSLKIMLVTGTQEGAEQLMARLKANQIAGETSVSDGFSNFVVHREADPFLASA